MNRYSRPRVKTKAPHQFHSKPQDSCPLNDSYKHLADFFSPSDEALLAKYGLKANDAILAEEKHMGLYDDLLENYDAKLIAGGAAQNTARGAQVHPTFPFPSRKLQNHPGNLT